MTTIDVGSRSIGDGQPTYVIAEAGANHNRDLATAHRLIDVAAESGSDAVKFQTYSGATLYSRKTPDFDYLEGTTDKKPHELLEDISLPREWQGELARHARDLGIDFLSTPFDRQAVDELVELDVPLLKVASFEIVDLPFLEYVGSAKKPLVISTGMATLGEIEDALAACRAGGASEFCILQCASVYPAPAHIMNLRTIPTMKAAFGVPTGLSDHTLGIHIPAAAVALGADVIEKHYTLDRSSPGPDHPFAIEPDELVQMVTHIREVERAIGDGIKRGPSPEESAEMYAKARRSVVAACAIPAGTVLTREMLTVKRPGFGIKPKYIDALVGRVAKTDIEDDDIITWDLI
jgi:N,N'-diacetyllegionaminate synthase